MGKDRPAALSFCITLSFIFIRAAPLNPRSSAFYSSDSNRSLPLASLSCVDSFAGFSYCCNPLQWKSRPFDPVMAGERAPAGQRSLPPNQERMMVLALFSSRARLRNLHDVLDRVAECLDS